MLAARIKAAADFDAEILDGSIQGERLCSQPRTQLAGKAARRRNPEFARVSARACGDVDNGARSGSTQSDSRELAIEIWQIGLTDPAEHNVLLYSRPNAVTTEAPRQSREFAHLRR